ncbi:MFS transporter [Nonomuraea longicatena]|uniref:MFS transporter n=1 Tax=Nonomuraea longicatena TaxID=83682 RepID=A0ABP4B4P8_9ACTN
MRSWWALGAVTLGTFMTYLDNNIQNVALPTIQRELGLTLAGLEWITTAYILVFAGLMLAGGRLADLVGARRVFMAGMVVFTLASLVAGLATTGGVLIGARAVQGVGAALLTPTALALLIQTFPDPRERARAVGIWSSAGALSMALGPVAGGFISQYAHWGWIYLINVPVGLATLWLAWWALPATARTVRRRLDLPGLITSTLALFALTLALIEGPIQGWDAPLIIAAFAAAKVCFALFLHVERRSPEPMLDLSLFRDRVFGGGVLAMGIWSFSVFGVYFFSALWLQNSLGFTPTEAGAAFVPMAVVIAVTALLAQRLADAIGLAATVALALALMGGGIYLMAGVGADGGYADVLPWFLLYGLGNGLIMPITAAVLARLPKERGGVGAGVMNVSREVFGLLGITLLGAILGSAQAGSALPEAAAFLDAYRLTLVVAAVILVAGIPIALLTLRARKAQTAAVSEFAGSAN